MGALSDIKVLELGQVVAAPFCGVLLADFGAEVIKVEQPNTGDSLRKMGPVKDGRSLWFAVENRNKKSITLNLKTEKGKEILKRLIEKTDIILENFRPGVLEKLGFPWEEIHKINKRAILVRISGYGQTGPYKNRYGYDRIGLGMGGLTYITGFPDMPPLRPGTSLADYLSGYAAALGALIAIYNRDVKGTGEGQEIELGLYEPVFRTLEFTAVDYYLNGKIRERVGNSFPATVPSGHFKTKDGKWISLSVGNDRIFERFAKCIKREDLLERPEYATHVERMQNREELDKIAEEWVAEHTYEECFEILGNEVPVGPIYSIKDIFEDPHYRERGNIIEVPDKLWGKVKMQGIVPKMSLTPGEVKWIGPELGEHNFEVYKNILGFSESEIKDLKEKGVI
jgi:crotonobetainyl-CoA:carnitine CoA-transferase CaiB-like acyl-CoA transferase